MLTEFAFTPSIFDEDAHEDKEAWRDQLKELGLNMFPRVSAWPVVVSDLYAGSWNQIAGQAVKSIKDQRARILCEGILQNMKKTLVTRPVCGSWPDEDVAWCREAIASSGVEPIERIVTDLKSKSALLEECRFIRSLDEVENGGFWQGIGSESSPRMIIADQVQLLRKLSLHSEWIALISKDIYGGSDDETDFALGVIDAALNRPADFGSVDFELHTEGPRRSTGQADYEAKRSGVINAISGCVKAKLTGSQSMDLLVWPKLLDRFLIAGAYTTESGGAKKKSPRWGVLLSHIARKPDQSKPDFYTEWKLLNRESLARWFGKYVADSSRQASTQKNHTDHLTDEVERLHDSLLTAWCITRPAQQPWCSCVRRELLSSFTTAAICRCRLKYGHVAVRHFAIAVSSRLCRETVSD